MAPPILPQEFAKSADTEHLIRRSMTKGYQYFSLLSPPLYTVFVLTRPSGAIWTINRLLRATSVGGAIGLTSGGLLEFMRTMRESEETLRCRRIRAAYDLSSLRGDDHSTIGSVLGAVLTPALFWKRARSVYLFIGGAGLGAGAGLISHWVRGIVDEDPSKPKSSPQTQG